MKTVVCGLGKCGSRMVLDLNALIFGGKYSCQLRFPKDRPISESWLTKFKNLFRSGSIAVARDIHPDEVPPMHLGDSDGQNEVLNMCNVESGDEKDEERRKRLKDNIVAFDNYHDACGQYHLIGEEVMRNLFATCPLVKPSVIDQYIKQNDKDNVSTYFIMFSAGGGTGCGTSTILAEKIADRANEQNHNMLIVGIAALPGRSESENYQISAGRFLTKFLSSPRSTSFDTVLTVSNSIMESIEKDSTYVQTEANMFAAHLIFSIINSSSKYARSSVNPDGPELRKNIHGLAYFCYAQRQAQSAEPGYMIGLELLQKALSPVSSGTVFNQAAPDPMSFEGASISFTDKDDFTLANWNEMLDKIGAFNEFVMADYNIDNYDDYSGEGGQTGNVARLKEKLNELFDNPLKQLPLTTRSCKNVVILRGIPENSQSPSWEQTCLSTLVETLFPKAKVHYYATYHAMKEDTLTLIPSDYISGEIIDMIIEYLTSVWEKDADSDVVLDLLLAETEPVDEDSVIENFGDHEVFEHYFPDFIRMRQNTTGRFGLNEDDWNEKYIKASQVTDMMNNVHEIIKNIKREKKERKVRRSLGI